MLLSLTALALFTAPAARSQLGVSTDEPPAPAAPPTVDLASLERAYRKEGSERGRARLVLEMAQLPAAAPLLGQIVASDPSDDVALAAAYGLRRLAMAPVIAGLDQRWQSGKRDPAARDRLAREIERHQVFAAGQNLPHFLREAPPVFSLNLDQRASVRVLAFGDFGDGSSRQEHMAESTATSATAARARSVWPRPCGASTRKRPSTWRSRWATTSIPPA